MFRVAPYRSNNDLSKDVFDLFDDFFKPIKTSYSFKVDVRDLKDKYIVDASLPGIDKKDINVKYEDDILIISVNKEEEKEDKNNDYIHREIHNFTASRKIHLKDVDPKKLKATMDNGILTITLPRLKEKLSSYLIDIE